MDDIRNIGKTIDAKDTASRWNKVYQSSNPEALNIAKILRVNDYLLPASGTALDLASGIGANAIYLAKKGLKTQAWDISDEAIRKINAYAKENKLPLSGKIKNLVEGPLKEASFDVIIVVHYLDRELATDIINALNPGGLLFYQTFTLEKTTFAGPKNPDFLLKPNELLSLFAPLRVISYREDSDQGDLSQGLRDEAMLVARKP